jgi:cell division protein FtsW (lipid II flippase)
VAFAVLLMAGLLLYQRLYGTSASVLVVLGLIFGAAGIYAGWIAATMVFAALRGGGD